jgi:hypothetical protein
MVKQHRDLPALLRKLVSQCQGWRESVENHQNEDVQYFLEHKEEHLPLLKDPYAVAFQKATLDLFTEVHEKFLVQAPHAAPAFERAYKETVDALRRLASVSGDIEADLPLVHIDLLTNTCKHFAEALESEHEPKEPGQTGRTAVETAGKPADKGEKAATSRVPTDKDMISSEETLVDLYVALEAFLDGQETGKPDVVQRAMRGASEDPVHHFRRRAAAIRDRLAELGFVSVPDIPNDVEHIFVWCYTVITGLRATGENPPQPTDDALSRPMPLTDIADRLLRDPKKWRKVKTLLGDSLRRLSDKNWVVKLDAVPPNWRKELERR